MSYQDTISELVKRNNEAFVQLREAMLECERMALLERLKHIERAQADQFSGAS